MNALNYDKKISEIVIFTKLIWQGQIYVPSIKLSTANDVSGELKVKIIDLYSSTIKVDRQLTTKRV